MLQSSKVSRKPVVTDHGMGYVFFSKRLVFMEHIAFGFIKLGIYGEIY